MRSRLIGVVVVAVLTSFLPATANAQWLGYKTPGIPRLPDGKPNLSAPAPKTPDGKPDLSGIWSGAVDDHVEPRLELQLPLDGLLHGAERIPAPTAHAAPARFRISRFG